MKHPDAQRRGHVRPAHRALFGFTMVELLVVIAIMAVMATLMAPAVRGLVGVGGRRGGMNMVTTAVEQARLSAIENGVNAYLAFPQNDPGLGSGAVIVLRRLREDEEGEPDDIKAVTRWQRLPRGVYLEADDAGSFGDEELANDEAIPRLGGDPVAVDNLEFFQFDRFGQLRPNNELAVLRIGEKTAADAQSFLGNANNHFELTIQPLTGRVVVEDKSIKR